jgi:hypothetical protein
MPMSLVVRCQTHTCSCPPWMDGTLFMSPHISKHLQWMSRCLHAWLYFMSWQNSKQSNGFEPFGGLLKSTLDDFLRSDCNYLQLPRLQSKCTSIDHEKNISSCIARVAALQGTFENCPVGGGKLNPRSIILIWDTGASYGLTFAVILSTTWSAIFLYGMFQKLTRSLGSGTRLHEFTNIQSKATALNSLVDCLSPHWMIS